ncbi:cation diffusion facilitator family transporter [Prevotella koreensis]|uniref:cation diffusion facilitator family transporter n=1 Tax=Prevotella koreensis TaxID=2490854 RepID=UPI0028E266E3|nr:cation diffusion facilitator family transporter [Prevotella koreensis]
MNDSKKQLEEWAELDSDAVDFDDLESKLESELEEQMSDLEGIEQDREKIGNPDTIGKTVMNVVWEQFINQVGVIAGEDFIKENGGLTLDLRDNAHIQTTENFAKGKIASHNTKIDYQQRYDDWQSNFQYDENGNVILHSTRTGKQEATLVAGARKPFDNGRPTGSVEKGTDMDHTISAAEIIRDPAANAHMTKEEQIDFANSPANLNEMDAGQNRSKGDKSMTDWLDNPNKNGQKPDEIFDISKEQDKQYRKKDEEARGNYEERKKEAEQRSIEAGKQSKKEEAFRIGGKALQSVIMGLLASLIKDIIRKLIVWFRSGNRKLSTFIDSVKKAIKSFISNMKEHLLNAGKTLVTTIATALYGPVIGMLKKAWIFLKQGYKSVKDAIKFFKNPVNKNMPFSIKMMEVGKIVIGGLTAGGAIVLSEVIEKGLMTIPIFAFPIPLLGSLASLIGMFLGALVSGLIGALALNMIDRLIAKKLKRINDAQQNDKRNDILTTQDKLISVVGKKTEFARETAFTNIQDRHLEATKTIHSSIEHILQNSEAINMPLAENAEIVEEKDAVSENEDALNDLFTDLKNI